MFTGIIEEVGRVVAIEDRGDAARLTIHGPTVVFDASHGDSIAVNGCCLTVTTFDAASFSADVMAESLARTNLGDLREGSPVNLERAVAAGARLGGHIVQGHVDGAGTVEFREPGDHWEVFGFAAEPGLLRYLVTKGSVTVDGASLTVVDVTDTHFTVSLIPTTLADTTLGDRAVGERVNIEVDILAKYVERLLP